MNFQNTNFGLLFHLFCYGLVSAHPGVLIFVLQFSAVSYKSHFLPNVDRKDRSAAVYVFNYHDSIQRDLVYVFYYLYI